MSKKHQKHAKITKPNYGQFARQELAILGTPCGEIKKISQTISEALADQYSIAYVDADHKSADDSTLTGTSLDHGNELEYVDKINFHRFDTRSAMNPWLFRPYFNDQELVIVNGNHFEASQQIVVIDSRKSLEKKLHKLTNVVLILLPEGESIIPDYLHHHIENIDQIPNYLINDLSQLTQWIDQQLKQSIAPLNGLVLAGGKSERMQKDKSQINYHGKSQKTHMLDLLSDATQKAFFAIREDQAEEKDSIKDTFTGLGPYGAILSAFRHDPNAAWLVTACDQPFLTHEVINLLIKKRNPSKVATAFYNPDTDFPEPLITIWEPKSYPYLLQFLSQGYSCPRKVLINTDIELVHLDDPSVLRNVNTPDEYEAAIKEIK